MAPVSPVLGKVRPDLVMGPVVVTRPPVDVGVVEIAVGQMRRHVVLVAGLRARPAVVRRGHEGRPPFERLVARPRRDIVVEILPTQATPQAVAQVGPSPARPVGHHVGVRNITRCDLVSSFGGLVCRDTVRHAVPVGVPRRHVVVPVAKATRRPTSVTRPVTVAPSCLTSTVPPCQGQAGRPLITVPVLVDAVGLVPTGAGLGTLVPALVTGPVADTHVTP